MVAKSVQNKNNLKQIAGAFSMYSDDHGGLAVGIGESSGRYFFGNTTEPARRWIIQVEPERVCEPQREDWQDPVVQCV